MLEFVAYVFNFVAKGFIRAFPLVLLTVPISIWLKKSRLAQRWIPTMRARPLFAILVAAAAGAVSPLCSCGVIPVIAGLLRAGTPLGPVMAFWIASPSMDPEIFALSTSYLGLPLAVARLVATGLSSVLAGFVAHAMEKAGLFGDDFLRGAARRGSARNEAARRFVPASRGKLIAAPALFAATTPAAVAPISVRPAAARPASPTAATTALPFTRPACSCGAAPVAQTASTSPFSARIAGLARESLPEVLKLSGVMLLAFFLEALVIRFVPVDIIAPLLGKDSAFAVPLATLIGVPLYATNLAALGLVSGLLAKGMSEGAALAFLIGGAATTLPAMTAVWSLVKPKVFALYLGAIVAAALASGWIWELLSRLARA